MKYAKLSGLAVVCAIGGVVACGASPGVDSLDSVAVSEDVATTSESLTTLQNNWDTSCGDVSVRTRGGLAPVTLYVSPTGNDSAAGTSVATALASLAGAQNKVTDLAHRDYTIIVKGGTYRAQTVEWTRVADQAHIHIKAAPGETPIFDGYRPGETSARLKVFFHLIPDPVTSKTNVTLEGLTITHYIQDAIIWRGQCGRVYNNRILQNGDTYANCLPPYVTPTQNSSHWIINGPGPGCADGTHPGECCPTEEPVLTSNGCWCTGFGAIDVVAASHNLLKHNDIVDFTSGHGEDEALHAFYVAASGTDTSTYNRIEDNYVRNVSGGAMKVRDGSAHNTFVNNYMERVNKYCFGKAGNNDYHNSVTGNVCTFWNLQPFASFSGSADTTLTDTLNFYLGTLLGVHGAGESGTPDTYQNTGRYMQPVNNPSNTGSTTLDEIVTASTTADIDGDGKPEVFVALYYPTLNYTKVVYSDGGKPDLRTIAYTNIGWKVNALTKIRPLNATKDQVVGAFYLAATDQTQVWVGAATTDGRYNLNGGTKLLDSSGASGWKVNALTAGKFGQDSADVLVTAAVVGGVQQIWRGDGHTAQSGSSIPGVAITSLYSSSNWRVTAMTNGNIANVGNQLITAYHWVASSTQLNRIYTGDGFSGANSAQILPDTTKIVTSLAVGRLGGATPRLVSGFDASGTGQVYVWTGTTIGASPIYSNQFWDITSLATGAVDAASNDQLITSIDQVGRTEVRWADGTTGITNGGTLYAFP